jgi:hypothetical protein
MPAKAALYYKTIEKQFTPTAQQKILRYKGIKEDSQTTSGGKGKSLKKMKTQASLAVREIHF